MTIIFYLSASQIFMSFLYNHIYFIFHQLHKFRFCTNFVQLIVCSISLLHIHQIHLCSFQSRLFDSFYCHIIHFSYHQCCHINILFAKSHIPYDLQFTKISWTYTLTISMAFIIELILGSLESLMSHTCGNIRDYGNAVQKHCMETRYENIGEIPLGMLGTYLQEHRGMVGKAILIDAQKQWVQMLGNKGGFYENGECKFLEFLAQELQEQKFLYWKL